MVLLRILTCVFLFSSVSAGTPYVVFQENGKSGVKNEQGKIIIPAEYEAIGWTTGKFSVVDNVTGFRQGNKWGLVDINNRRVSKNEYRELYPGEGSYLVAARIDKVTQRVLFGCLNTSGKQIIPFQYSGIRISSLRAIVFSPIGNQVRYGVIDLQNKTIIPQRFQEIRPFGSLRFSVKDFEGKTAIYSDAGQQMTEFVIDSVSTFKNEFAVFFQNEFQGIISRDGTIRAAAKFREVELSESAPPKARLPDRWFFISKENRIERTVSADSVIAVAPKIFKVMTAGHAHLVDEALSPVTGAVFRDVGKFEKGKAWYQLGSLYGAIQRDGKVIVPALYNKLVLNDNYILARQRTAKGDTWILFDSAGTRKNIRPYQTMRSFAPGLLLVQHRDHYGLMNQEGTEIVSCAYDSIFSKKGEMLLVKFKGLYGIINTKEEWVVSPRQNRMTPVNDETFVEFTPGASMLKRRNGGIIYFTSNPIRIFSDHLLEYLPSGTIWKIDLNGTIADRTVTPAEPTEAIYEESEGYRAIRRNGRYGFIDARGRLRIANRYEAVKPFKEGLAPVKILGKWGFINVQDKIAVQPVYDEVQAFKSGYAIVSQKGVLGLINREGKPILPVRYQLIEMLPTGNLLIEINGVKGLANNSGRILIQPKHDYLSDTGEGFVITARDGRFGVLNYTGVPVIAAMYDHLYFDKATGLFVGHQRSHWDTIDVK